MDFSKHLSGMGLNEKAPKYSEKSQKPVSIVFTGKEFKEERAKVRAALVENGVSEDEVDAILDDAEAKTKEMLEKIQGGIEKKSGTPKFGCYALGAVLGYKDGATWDALIDKMSEKYKKEPDTMVMVPFNHLMDAARFLKTAEMKARELGEEGFASASEFGASSFVALSLRVLGEETMSPKKVMKRLASLHDGTDPDDLEFQPLFDKEMERILPAWKKYKSGEMSREDWTKFIADELGDTATTCQCSECQAILKKH